MQTVRPSKPARNKTEVAPSMPLETPWTNVLDEGKSVRSRLNFLGVAMAGRYESLLDGGYAEMMNASGGGSWTQGGGSRSTSH